MYIPQLNVVLIFDSGSSQRKPTNTAAISPCSCPADSGQFPPITYESASCLLIFRSLLRFRSPLLYVLTPRLDPQSETHLQPSTFAVLGWRRFFFPFCYVNLRKSTLFYSHLRQNILFPRTTTFILNYPTISYCHLRATYVQSLTQLLTHTIYRISSSSYSNLCNLHISCTSYIYLAQATYNYACYV